MKMLARSICGKLLDAAENRYWVPSGQECMTILRHPQNPRLYRLLLRWMALNAPDVRKRFSLHCWPVRVEQLGASRLLIPWVQDPIPSWSQIFDEELTRLTQHLDARGVATFNPTSGHRRLARSALAHILDGTGIRIPRVWPLESRRDWDRAVAECQGSLVIRKDFGHGGNFVRYRRAEIPSWDQLPRFQGAAAAEFIDTSGEDGVFWKYRCLCAGSRQISVHAIASRSWEVRGTNKILGKIEREREAEYMSVADPQAPILNKVANLLQFDLLAFDYSLDQHGNVVLWEGNPNPGISFKPHAAELKYRHRAFHRAYAAFLFAYFERAGIEPPPLLDALTRYDEQRLCASLLQKLQTPD